MVITVAGEKKEVKDGLTLPELIEQENVEMPEYVTVSINEEFIATEDKESTVLKEGDNVVLTGGLLDGSSGTTNMIKVERIDG